MSSTCWNGGQDGGVLSSCTSSALLSAVLGGVQSCSRAVGMEAARSPFRINEGPRGTGVMLLLASPAAGLQMGAFRWGWEGRSMWEEGSKSHSDSVTPLVPQLSRGAGGWFLDGK